MNLVIEDGSRVESVYFMMSEENVKKKIAQPWMSFGSDAEAPAPDDLPEGAFRIRETPRADQQAQRWS